MILRIIFIFSSLVSFVISDEVSCTAAFCEKYMSTNTCPKISSNCQTQSIDKNGLFLPYPGPCNCCEFCLDNLKEGEDCSIGSASSPLSTSICGDGLSCKANKCTIIDTDCTRKQRRYDDRKEQGKIGHMQVRPNCDADGNYKPYQCIPNEICYCVDEMGERIYGEMLNTSPSLIDLTMKCGCSRYFHLAKDTVGQNLYPMHRFRCMPNGDFDQIQCIGNDCFCVDSEDGTPTYPEEPTVNVSQVTASTLPCFNKDIHVPYFYYHECETELNNMVKEMQDIENDGYSVFGYNLPNCNLNGKYGLVQSNKSHKYCSDPDGNVMENFSVELATTLADTMNCFCAKARTLVIDVEKPTCLNNGNYNPIQCRRGMCRCVDENGNQIKLEDPFEEKDTLICDERNI